MVVDIIDITHFKFYFFDMRLSLFTQTSNALTTGPSQGPNNIVKYFKLIRYDGLGWFK